MLVLCHPQGPACHTGAETCFGPGRALLDTLGRTIRERARSDPRECFVARQLGGPREHVARKVGEEAVEVLLARRGSDDLVGEVADLWFHSMVLLARDGLDPLAPLEVLAAATTRLRLGLGLSAMEHPDTHTISSPDQLWELVGQPTELVIRKELPALDERATTFIATSPFLVMATTGADGSADASPKGGPAGFVRVLEPTRLLVPEFPGNRRFDGVQNLVERPGIGLLFVVPGISETLRVNGHRAAHARPRCCSTRAPSTGDGPGSRPTSRCGRSFSHCAKAFLRSDLWKPESWPDGDGVVSPSRSIGRSGRGGRRRESEVRREVEAEYRPELY